MPYRAKPNLSPSELLACIRSSRYEIDVEQGEITSARTGRPLLRWGDHPTRHSNGRNDCITLYWKGKRINTTVAKVIWMRSRDRTLPEGVEIHHLDEDHSNNHWRNLLAIVACDHTFAHELLRAADAVPF